MKLKEVTVLLTNDNHWGYLVLVVFAHTRLDNWQFEEFLKDGKNM